MSIFSAVFSGLALFVIALLAISPAFHGGVRKMIFEHCEGMAMDLPQPIIDFEPSFDADVGSHSIADTASSPPRHTIKTVLDSRIIGAEGYGDGPGQRPHDRNVAPLPKPWADSHPGMPGMSEEALALLNEGAHDERATILGKDGHGLPPAHLGPPAHILGKDGHGQPPAHILGKDGHGRPPVEQHLLGANGHGLPPAYLRDTPSTSSMVGRLATTSITSAVSVKDGVRRLTATIGWSMPMPKDHPMPPPTAKDLMAEPEPMHEQCERVAKWAGMFGPQMLLAWALFELCIFVPAVMLAKRSLRLYKTARRLGASAI